MSTNKKVTGVMGVLIAIVSAMAVCGLITLFQWIDAKNIPVVISSTIVTPGSPPTSDNPTITESYLLSFVSIDSCERIIDSLRIENEHLGTLALQHGEHYLRLRIEDEYREATKALKNENKRLRKDFTELKARYNFYRREYERIK